MSPVPSSAPSTVPDVLAHVRDAADRRIPLRVRGAGTWATAGRAVRADHTLTTARLTGILEYVPGDFTLTARAGTPLADVARAAALHGQWLALDPFGSPQGTLGATVATASAGPLAHGFGLPREHVLGLEVVTGSGQVVRGGGRVVKNVAGFDLTRLFTGSWGTLGVITEVTVRTRALPTADETLAVAAPASMHAESETLDGVLGAIRAAPAPFYAAELLDPALAARLEVGDTTTVLLRLAGNTEVVQAQRAWLARLGPAWSVGSRVWPALREVEPVGATVVRFSRAPSHLATLWNQVHRAVSDVAGAVVHASVGRGVVRAILPTADVAELERFAQDALWLAASAIPERLPEPLWMSRASAALESRTSGGAGAASHAIRSRLWRRVKDTFDPMHILNPGILGEAIA